MIKTKPSPEETKLLDRLGEAIMDAEIDLNNGMLDVPPVFETSQGGYFCIGRDSVNARICYLDLDEGLKYFTQLKFEERLRLFDCFYLWLHEEQK